MGGVDEEVGHGAIPLCGEYQDYLSHIMMIWTDCVCVLLPMGITFLCLVPRCRGGGAGMAGSQLPSSRDRLELILDTGVMGDLESATCPHPPGQNPRHPALLFRIRLHLGFPALVII